MTHTHSALSCYIAAYDTEQYDRSLLPPEVPTCLEACRRIVEVHRKHAMPATFFIVGKALEATPAGFRALLDDPLFEIASHTYSHRILRDHPFCGPAASLEQIQEEIVRGKAVVEEVFGRPCLGMRTACGFTEGLRGAPEVLRIVQEAGYRYISSKLWGPDYSLPADLSQSFTYADDGFPALREFPGHGWHENLLKDHNRWGPSRLTLWPQPFPEAIPAGFCKTPKDDFEVNKVFLDKALETRKPFVSLIWHPWSLAKFDPDMKMLELTFTHVQETGLKPCTYSQLHGHLSGSASSS